MSLFDFLVMFQFGLFRWKPLPFHPCIPSFRLRRGLFLVCRLPPGHCGGKLTPCMAMFEWPEESPLRLLRRPVFQNLPKRPACAGAFGWVVASENCVFHNLLGPASRLPIRLFSLSVSLGSFPLFQLFLHFLLFPGLVRLFLA